MENDVDVSPTIKKWLIIGGVALLSFIIVFFVVNNLVNGKKKETTPAPEVKEEEYEAYKEGDSVTLKDNSKWHVLYDSKENIEFISLLSDEDVNTSSVLYGNINSFLKGTYKTSIKEKLNIESTDIQEIRLLAYLDLENISKAKSEEFLPDIEINKFNIPEFIYEKPTVTDTVYKTDQANNPIMFCSSVVDGKVDKFCLGDSTKVLPVRPVLVVSKKVINTKNTTENTQDEDKNKDLEQEDNSLEN